MERRTFTQLWEDALARRWVRWYPSGSVEKLRITKKGNAVCAYAPNIADHYIVAKRYADRTFAYELVTAENAGTKAENYAAAKNTRHFVETPSVRKVKKIAKKAKKAAQAKSEA